MRRVRVCVEGERGGGGGGGGGGLPDRLTLQSVLFT